ncbi:MAG: hypothetical protein QOF73_1722 [Thermomicrobiales bacterium]|jgi:hypothetical protein|nr:hypothetical protein [Thermomicrobiales bacterium]
MTTRLELRTAVRRRLEDTGGSPLWDDASLNDFLTEAMRRYGARFPKELSTTANVAAGATSAAVAPAIAASQVVRVFDSAGHLIPRQHAIEPGDSALAGLASAQAWRWWGSNLVLAQPAGTTGDWQIDYLGGRALPNDDATAVEVVSGDEDIVVLLAAATALWRRAIEDGKRGVGRTSQVAIQAAAEAFQNEAERLMSTRRRRARGGWTATG